MDAAQGIKKYADESGKDVTHIYSYNKVMSEADLKGICAILNRTQWLVLVWYWGPDSTQKSGLTNFRYVTRMPMQSTGKEKFSAYVFVRELKKREKK